MPRNRRGLDNNNTDIPEKTSRKKTNKENIQTKSGRNQPRNKGNVVLLVDSTTDEESKKIHSDAQNSQQENKLSGEVNKTEETANKTEEPALKTENIPKTANEDSKKKKITLKLKSDNKDAKKEPVKSTSEEEPSAKSNEKTDENKTQGTENKVEDEKAPIKSEKESKAKANKKTKPKSKKLPEKKKSNSRSDSESPPRFTEPLKLNIGNTGRFGRDRGPVNIREPPVMNRGPEMDRANVRVIDQRDFGRGGRGRMGGYRGPPGGPNYRGGMQQGTDFRGMPYGGEFRDYRVLPQGPPDFRGYAPYQGPPSGFPGPYAPGYPPPPPVPVLDPREDPNYHGYLQLAVTHLHNIIFSINKISDGVALLTPCVRNFHKVMPT